MRQESSLDKTWQALWGLFLC